MPERLPEAHQRRDFFTQYLTNNLFRREEADFYPARLFNDAARWLYDNDDADSFFLVVDSFDPHEPWEPPVSYRRLYDPDDDVTDIIQSLYAPNAGVLNEREVKRVQANYAGEVTLCDRWFGHFMEQLELSGRADDTVVIVASDHGHNLRYPDDKGLISKQGHPLTRAVADLVLLVRYPDRARAGETYDGLVTNTDIAATVLATGGVEGPTEGRDIGPALRENLPSHRSHVSIGWGPLMTVITDDWWCNATIWGEAPPAAPPARRRDAPHQRRRRPPGCRRRTHRPSHRRRRRRNPRPVRRVQRPPRLHPLPNRHPKRRRLRSPPALTSRSAVRSGHP